MSSTKIPPNILRAYEEFMGTRGKCIHLGKRSTNKKGVERTVRCGCNNSEHGKEWSQPIPIHECNKLGILCLPDFDPPPSLLEAIEEADGAVESETQFYRWCRHNCRHYQARSSLAGSKL